MRGMLTPLSPLPPPDAAHFRARRGPLFAWARRWPFVGLIGIAILSNIAGSFFNIAYNFFLIDQGVLNPQQQDVFRHVATPIYNLVAYPACVVVAIVLIWPVVRGRRKLEAALPIAPGELELCRRRLLNFPFQTMCINFVGWFPGALYFPLLICGLGGASAAGWIWLQFAISFTVSAILTTVQTFFLVETYLIAVLYADFFQDARPAEMTGVVRISFRWRLILLWFAVALGPLLALLAVAVNFILPRTDYPQLALLAGAVFAVGAASGGLIFWFVGRDVLSWMQTHAAATEQIALENFDIRIPHKRPDEWGRLTDGFNDMASALGQARQVYETFGQVVGPEVREELKRYPGLGGEVQEITVLFADIRGFTARSAGENPERMVHLLNRFATLVVQAIEERGGGFINKFLGDGVMALFNAPRRRPDHAALAVAAARELLRGLDRLNHKLALEGQAPLQVGIGIHTGPALVGVIGAIWDRGDGRQGIRKEFTAIGETVNLSQRLEQWTKQVGGPILVSAATRARLGRDVPVTELGPQLLPGCQESMVIFRVDS